MSEGHLVNNSNCGSSLILSAGARPYNLVSGREKASQAGGQGGLHASHLADMNEPH